MAFFDTCTQLHAQTVVPGILVHRHSYQTPLYPIRFPSSSGVHAPGGIVAWARTGGVSTGVATASDNNSAKATFAKRCHCLRLEASGWDIPGPSFRFGWSVIRLAREKSFDLFHELVAHADVVQHLAGD